MKLMITDRFDLSISPVRIWLKEYLYEHIEGWMNAYQLEWSKDEILAHIIEHDLVEQEYAELEEALSHKDNFLRCAYVNEQLVGIIYVETRLDRYMKVVLASISWLYVDTRYRKKTVASQLVECACSQLSKQGIKAIEVMTTDSNISAVGCYHKNGFLNLDSRMLAEIK